MASIAPTANFLDVVLMTTVMMAGFSLFIWSESGFKYRQQLVALPLFFLDMIAYMVAGRTVSQVNTWHYLVCSDDQFACAVADLARSGNNHQYV